MGKILIRCNLVALDGTLLNLNESCMADMVRLNRVFLFLVVLGGLLRRRLPPACFWVFRWWDIVKWEATIYNICIF